MKLTKDEARLLSYAINKGKYDMVKGFGSGRSDELDLTKSLDDFEIELSEYGKDKRRMGRASLNNMYDLFSRFMRRRNRTKA